MRDFSRYLGRKFEFGTNDCYSLFRDFYKNEFGIEMRDYARYDGFWNDGLNLYMDNFSKEGFYLLDQGERVQFGDVFLIALGCSIASHAAIYIGENKILHHVQGKLSSIDKYCGVYKNCTLGIIRHKDMNKIRREEYAIK